LLFCFQTLYLRVVLKTYLNYVSKKYFEVLTTEFDM